jgi:hypothetical protein
MTKRCQQCSEEFAPYTSRQRFCSRVCSDEWFQEERRAAVEFFRRNREAATEEAMP